MNIKGLQLFRQIFASKKAIPKIYQAQALRHYSSFYSSSQRFFSVGKGTNDPKKEGSKHPSIITSASTDQEDYAQQEDPAMQNAYEELKDPEVNNKDSAAKNLSVALLSTETPDQCLSLFEKEFLRQHRETIYPEELCLILYFLTKNFQNAEPEESYKIVQKDLRFTTLIDMLFQRLNEVEFEYVITTIWSLGICVSGYSYQMHAENKLHLLTILNQHVIPQATYSNLPALTFSIACFFNEDMNQLVQETIEKISQVYLDNMLQRMDILQASTLLMGWGRSYMANQVMIDRVANEIISKHKQKIFYEEGAVGEITNIIISLSDLRYRNDQLLDILQGYVMKMKSQLNIYLIALITNAYASLAPDRVHLFNDLAPELHEKLSAGISPETYRLGEHLKKQDLVSELVPDITTYNNLWLAITCFGIKSNIILQQNEQQQESADQKEDPTVRAKGLIKVIAKDLIKVFNGNRRWKATDLTISEASNIAIAITSLKLESEKFIADIGDIIRANVKESATFDLMNLAKSTFYFRNFQHTKDIYSHVHAECVTRYNLRKFNEEEVETLSRIYSNHGIMTDSPFANVRVSR